MKLAKLLQDLDITPAISGEPVDISGISFHSGKVQPGHLFVAIKGYQVDGHQYIQDAIQKGAAAVIGEQEMEGISVPYYRTGNARKALGKLARTFYGNPADKHIMIGITGTNGKTTTSFMVRHILEYAGISSALLGTVGYIINGKKQKTDNTTPDAVSLQKMLYDSKDEAVVMEVSSHGIDQDRVGGEMFDYAVFTNLSHDHLDYHKSMDEYFNVKARLFSYLKDQGMAIVNRDCPWGRQLADRLEGDGLPVASFGNEPNNDTVIQEVVSRNGAYFDILDRGELHHVKIPLPGQFNIENATAAFLTARQVGLEPEVILEALRTFPGVPGRFETYHHPNGGKFIVDYAHTPSALTVFLETIRSFEPDSVTHIFGFRGQRDLSKREDMVLSSIEHCDKVILTFDDLNGVPELEMRRNLEDLKVKAGHEKVSVIYDRTEAIQTAWNNTREGEWVLITGKGPENYQNTFKIPASSDAEMVKMLQKKQVWV